MEEIILFEDKKPKRVRLEKYRNWLFLGVVVLLLVAVLVYVLLTGENEGGLFINEIMLSNSETLEVSELGTPDWVELFNSSDRDISLLGYGISNHAKNGELFTFPDVTIGAGQYLIVYFAGDADKSTADMLITGFSLSKSGEKLYLSNAHKDIVDLLEVPALDTDVSYARRSDGTFGYCMEPTPEKENSTEILDELTN